MKTDAFLDFQRTAAADQAITATAFSGDWLDQLARRDLGSGGGLCLATNIGTAFAPTWSSEACTTTVATDLITLTSFALPVGTPVVFDTQATSTGLTEGTIYYVSYSDNTTANAFVVAPTLADALAGTNIVTLGGSDGTVNLTSLNTLEVQLVLAGDSADPGGDEFQIVGSSGPITIREARAVTFDETGGAAEDIVSLVGHGMTTGTEITFGTEGTLPTGVVGGTRYYVIDADDDYFQIATTRDNADDGIRVEFTGDGTPQNDVTIADGQLGASGPMIITELNPLPEDIGERFLRARYLVANGDFLAGTVRSHLVHTPDVSPKRYPFGVRIY